MDNMRSWDNDTLQFMIDCANEDLIRQDQYITKALNQLWERERQLTSKNSDLTVIQRQQVVDYWQAEVSRLRATRSSILQTLDTYIAEQQMRR